MRKFDLRKYEEVLEFLKRMYGEEVVVSYKNLVILIDGSEETWIMLAHLLDERCWRVYKYLRVVLLEYIGGSEN